MPKKTVTAKFRIGEGALKHLQEDAKRLNVSVNTMVNQLLVSYSQFDRPMKDIQMTKVPTSTFKTMLDGCSDEAVLEAARSAGEAVAEAFATSEGVPVALDSVLGSFRSSAFHLNAFDYSEFHSPGKVKVTMPHKLGRKGSLFIEEWVRCQLELLDGCPRFTVEDDSVTFEFGHSSSGSRFGQASRMRAPASAHRLPILSVLAMTSMRRDSGQRQRTSSRQSGTSAEFNSRMSGAPSSRRRGSRHPD